MRDVVLEAEVYCHYIRRTEVAIREEVREGRDKLRILRIEAGRNGQHRSGGIVIGVGILKRNRPRRPGESVSESCSDTVRPTPTTLALTRVGEDAEASADKEFACPRGVIGKTDARHHSVEVGRHQGRKHARIAGEGEPARSIGVDNRLKPRHEGCGTDRAVQTTGMESRSARRGSGSASK